MSAISQGQFEPRQTAQASPDLKFGIIAALLALVLSVGLVLVSKAMVGQDPQNVDEIGQNRQLQTPGPFRL